MRTGSWTVWAGVVAAAVLGCGSSYSSSGSGGSPAPAQCTAANAQTVTGAIQIQGMAYSPACAKVAPNTLVTFTNDDSVAHTVTTDAGQPETLDSGNIAPSGHFTHTFGTAGTIAIHCSIHPDMHLTVFVQ
jgi:plastocyanin